MQKTFHEYEFNDYKFTVIKDERGVRIGSMAHFSIGDSLSQLDDYIDALHELGDAMEALGAEYEDE